MWPKARYAIRFLRPIGAHQIPELSPLGDATNSPGGRPGPSNDKPQSLATDPRKPSLVPRSPKPARGLALLLRGPDSLPRLGLLERDRLGGLGDQLDRLLRLQVFDDHR